MVNCYLLVVILNRYQVNQYVNKILYFLSFP